MYRACRSVSCVALLPRSSPYHYFARCVRQVARRTTKDILAKFDASMAPAADVHALIAAHAATLAPSDAGGVFGMLCVCEHLFLAVLLVIVSSYVWSRACMCVVGVGSSALRHAGQFGVLSDREPLLGQQGGALKAEQVATMEALDSLSFEPAFTRNAPALLPIDAEDVIWLSPDMEFEPIWDDNLLGERPIVVAARQLLHRALTTQVRVPRSDLAALFPHVRCFVAFTITFRPVWGVLAVACGFTTLYRLT